MLVLILLTDIDLHLLQEESKTCPRDSTSLLLRLDKHTFHALSVITRSIQRVLADIVTVTLKPINSIQIDNLRPVDAHEVLFRSGNHGDGSGDYLK